MAAVQHAVEVIRKRIDRFGVTEPVIQPLGNDRIQVQLPGLEQALREEARETLQRTAFLEFRLVHQDNDTLLEEEQTDPAFVPPVGYEKLIEEEQTTEGRTVRRAYFVKRRPEMTGRYVKRATWQPTSTHCGRTSCGSSFRKAPRLRRSSLARWWLRMGESSRRSMIRTERSGTRCPGSSSTGDGPGQKSTPPIRWRSRTWCWQPRGGTTMERGTA